MTGQTPIIDGTGLGVPGGQWGLFTLQDSSYVVVQGFELRNYIAALRRDVPVGIYVFGAGSNVQIVNNHIHDIVTRAKTNRIDADRMRWAWPSMAAARPRQSARWS